MTIGNAKLVVARLLRIILANIFLLLEYFAFRQIANYEELEKMSQFHPTPFYNF